MSLWIRVESFLRPGLRIINPYIFQPDIKLTPENSPIGPLFLCLFFTIHLHISGDSGASTTSCKILILKQEPPQGRTRPRGIAPCDATSGRTEQSPSWPQPQVHRESRRKDHGALWWQCLFHNHHCLLFVTFGAKNWWV
jgi:hypothetical protein